MDVSTEVIVAWVTAVGVFLSAVVVRRTRGTSTSIEVDVHDLFDRIARLEEQVHRIPQLEADLAEAKEEIRRLRALETRLEAQAAARKGELTKLRTRLAEAEGRIRVLEEWIRAQGADPERIVNGFGGDR